MSLATGKQVLRVTVGPSEQHAEASLFELESGDWLLSDVFTDRKVRRQGLSRIAVAACLEYARAKKQRVVTYAHPHGSHAPTTSELYDFYKSVGFTYKIEHEQAGPFRSLLIFEP